MNDLLREPLPLAVRLYKQPYSLVLRRVITSQTDKATLLIIFGGILSTGWYSNNSIYSMLRLLGQVVPCAREKGTCTLRGVLLPLQTDAPPFKILEMCWAAHTLFRQLWMDKIHIWLNGCLPLESIRFLGFLENSRKK